MLIRLLPSMPTFSRRPFMIRMRSSAVGRSPNTTLTLRPTGITPRPHARNTFSSRSTSGVWKHKTITSRCCFQVFFSCTRGRRLYFGRIELLFNKLRWLRRRWRHARSWSFWRLPPLFLASSALRAHLFLFLQKFEFFERRPLVTTSVNDEHFVVVVFVSPNLRGPTALARHSWRVTRLKKKQQQKSNITLQPCNT